MTTNTTTHEITVNAETLEQPIDVHQQVERIRVGYDPSRVRTLATRDMQAIEDDIWAAHDRGLGPKDLQDLIGAHLERIGVEPRDIHDGRLVVRVEDVEGKADLRAIVTDYADFGTRIRHTDLIPEEDTSVHEDEEITAEEQRAQEHMLETVMDDIRGSVRRVSQEIESNGSTRRMTDAVIDDTTGHLQVMMKRLLNSEPIERYELARMAEDEIPSLLSVLNKEATARDDERVAVRRLTGDVEDASHQNPNLDSEHREVLRDVLRRVSGAVDDLHANSSRAAGASEQAMQTIGVVGRVVSEMSYSQHGGESYGSQLRQLLQVFEEQIGDGRMLRRQSDELIDAISRQLNN